MTPQNAKTVKNHACTKYFHVISHYDVRKYSTHIMQKKAQTGAVRIILEAKRTARTETMLNHLSWIPFSMKRLSIYVLWPTKGSMEFYLTT